MKKRPAPQRHRPLFYSLFFLYPHHIRGDLGQRMRTAHLHGVSQLTGQLINVALHAFLAAAIHSRDERAADQHILDADGQENGMLSAKMRSERIKVSG